MATPTDLVSDPAHNLYQHVIWASIRDQVEAVSRRWDARPVYGVPRGGSVPAAMLAGIWGVPVLDDPAPGCLVIDDLVDSGSTAARYVDGGYRFDALYRKPHSPTTYAPRAEEREGWLVFPWEGEETAPLDAVRRLLEYIGEDPGRDGLLDTPKRVVKAWAEMTTGYALDPADVLGVQFQQDEDASYQGIVVLRAIPFSSLCEHHVLPFTGVAHVAYIPGESGKIVGLSKLARLVGIYAKRLQVQERMTTQIVEALVRELEPRAAACVIRAEHTCMSLRGVEKHAGGMVTSELRGAFKDDPRARQELMDLLAT